MTDIAELKAKMEADTRQFDQAMKGSNKHMEDAKKLVSEWSDEFKTASEDVDKYVKKLEGRIEDLEKQNEKSTDKMGDATKRLKDNVDKNTKYIQERYGAIGKASEEASKSVSDFSRVLKWSLYIATAGLAGTTSLAVIRQQSFELNRELDETIRLMKQISGRSGEAIARDIFEMNTPFSRDVLTSSAYQQLASKQPASQVSPKLQLYADTAFGLGGDDQTYQSISTAMALLGNRGTEFEGYSSLANLGINVDEYVKPLGDGSTLAALERVERGAVSTEELVQQVTIGMNKDFAGLIDSQEKTYTSAMNTIGRYIEETARKFGESWYDKMRKAANNVADLFVDMLESDQQEQRIERVSKALDDTFSSLAKRAETIARSMMPVVEAFADFATAGVEVGSTIVKSADPAITSMSRSIEIFGKGLAWVTGLITGALEKFKGLAHVFGILFSTRVIGGIARMVTNFKGLWDLLKFTRGMGKQIQDNFKTGFDYLKKGSKDLKNEFRRGIPKSIQGFARGAAATFVGVRKGFSAAVTGIQSGFYRATSGMNKTFSTFVRGLVGASRESVKAFGHLAKGSAAGLNLMSNSASKSFSSAGKAIGAFGKASASALGAFGKGLAVIGKWMAGFFTPFLAVVAAFHLLADVMNKDNERKQRAAEANRTYAQSLKDMNKELENSVEAYSLGTGPAIEPVNKREYLSRLMFANEEEETAAYERHKHFYGEQAQDPFTLLAAGSKRRNQRIKEELEAAGVYDPDYKHFTGRNMEEMAYHYVSRGTTNYAHGTRVWDQLAWRVGGMMTNERGGFNRMLGGNHDELFDRIDSIIDSFKLTQEQVTNFKSNFRKNIPELVEMLESTPGFERRHLRTEFGFEPKRGIAHPENTIESMIREHTEGMAAVDIAKVLADMFDYSTRARKEESEAIKSTTETYGIVDQAMLVNARGLKLASNSLLDLNKSAALAASGLESVADQAAQVLFQNTKLFEIGAAAHASETLRYGATDAADLFLNQGVPLTMQAGSIINTLQQSSVPLTEQFFSSASRNDIHFTPAERSSLVGKVLTENYQTLRTQMMNAGVPEKDIKTFEQNVLRGTDVDITGKKPKYTQKEISAIGESAGSLWLNNLERPIDDLTNAVTANTGATNSLTDNIQRYGEDGHLVLKEGMAWDLNFGNATVLDNNSQFFDARITGEDPFYTPSGGGSGGKRATEALIPTNPRFQLREVEPTDYSNIDGAALLEQNRIRNEIRATERRRAKMLEKVNAMDRDVWNAIDMGSLKPVRREHVVNISQAQVHIDDATRMPAVGMFAETMRQTSGATEIIDRNASGAPLRIKLEVIGTDGNPIEARVTGYDSGGNNVEMEVDDKAKSGRVHGPVRTYQGGGIIEPSWTNKGRQ